MKKSVLMLVACLLLLAPLSAASEDFDVDIHGFISQGYLKTDHNNYMAQTEEGSFEFNEMGLNFGTDLTEKLRIGMQLFARDLGKDGNDDLVLDWAFADYRWRDWLGFRVGRIKMPFGYYNSIRDFDMLRTSVFAPQSVYPEMLRDMISFMKGLSLYGHLSLGAWGSLSYNYLTGLPNVSKDTGYRGATEDFWSAYNLQVKEMSIDHSHSLECQWETPVPELLIGGNFYVLNDLYTEGPVGGSFWSDFNKLTYFKKINDMTGYLLLMRYAIEGLTLMGEYWENNTETWIDAEGASDILRNPRYEGYLKTYDLVNQGWYASVSYRFSDFFEMEYAYSEFYPDKSDKNGRGVHPDMPIARVLGLTGIKRQIYNEFEAWKKTSTLSCRFDMNDNWLIKLETAYNDGFGDYTSADNGDKKNLKRYWWLYAMKVTYSF